MKPVLKWVGGKTRILKKIKELFPDRKIRNYHEPFFGGGSVLFSLEDQIAGRIYINDFNKDLINVYKNIRKNPRELINKLKLLKRAYLKSKDKRAFYNKKRKHLNENKTFNSRRAALYIFINKTNFNGIMIKDKKDNVVSGWGQHKKPEIFTVSNIVKVSSFLNRRNIQLLILITKNHSKKQKKETLYLWILLTFLTM